MATALVNEGSRPSRRPTRAETGELEKQLRQAAVETFMEHGYHGTTMDAVARAGGITRRTLYARYPDKEALFNAVIPWALARYNADRMPTELPRDDLEASLTIIARAALARALDPEFIRLSVLMMAESARFPHLAQSDHSLTQFSPRMQVVTELLRQHADAGTIEIDDLELTAEQFLTMVATMPARMAAFGMRRTRKSEERHLQHAVGLFLRAVQPRDPDPDRIRRSLPR